jgi:HPr kinase/phosphorylase
MSLSFNALIAANLEHLALEEVSGTAVAERAILSADASDVVGHLNLIHPDRIQVIGPRELQWYLECSLGRRAAMLSELVAARPPALIVADQLSPPADLVASCRAAEMALYTSPIPTARVIDSLRFWITKAMTASISLHGVLMDVLGMGVLIAGDSGLGKSELALELISRGHGLVADDVVDFSRVGPQTVEGRCPGLLRNMLEVRGLGMLDIRTIFGETAVRRRMRLKLIVQLVRRGAPEGEVERLPLEAQTQDVLGVPIRKVVIPVAAGRNLAVLTEAAVRNTILQLRGIDSTDLFAQRQRRLIAGETLED